MKEYTLQLDFNIALREKFGSKKELVDLFNNATHIKENLRTNTFYGEVIRSIDMNKTLHTSYPSKAMKRILEIYTDRIGFRIDSIKLNKKKDIEIKIIPVMPLGTYIDKKTLENGTFLLHPRVPNFGDLRIKKFIPVTFDLILYPEPAEYREIKILKMRDI